MCGIVGFVGPPASETLGDMCAALAHRGPDGAGVFSDSEVSLGHRRLAIVDLAGGAQPAFNEDRTIALVFNGEIYNHAELRPELERLGHRFASDADTESIVHAYEQYGVHCLDRFVGMFAFVLYDMRHRALFGARDRMGEKPLYYTAQPYGEVRFAFASESKGLKRHPALQPAFSLSPTALIAYLLHDYTTGEQSIDAGVRRLPAGHAFTFGLPGASEEGFRSWPYWRLRFPSGGDHGGRLLELLDRAVERQLMSDVPLGVFLSGGVDSSSIVRLLAQHRPAKEIQTFSIGFDDPTFDESKYSTYAAGLLGTTHHIRQFTAADMVSRLPRLAAHLDEPFADPSILPVSMLCEFARERVTVALGGDGGDELLAGYDPFRALAPAQWYDRTIPHWLHERLAAPAARLLPVTDRNMELSFRVARFLGGAKQQPAYRAAAWMGPFSPNGLRRLVPDLAAALPIADLYADERRAAVEFDENGCKDDVARTLDFFQRCYLPDDILVKVDRASMFHSLEVRCPFLDPFLVAYANSLSSDLKLRGGETKWILKRRLEGPPELLPPEIVRRKKKGFGIPVARWLRNELRPEFESRVLHGLPRELDMIDQREVERLWHRHLGRAENHYKELWALLMLAWWRQTR